MARKPGAAIRVAAPPAPAPDGPHWQVARLASPGEAFSATDTRGNVTTLVADAQGIVLPRSIDELRLVDHLPVAGPATTPAPVADALPTEPTDDAGAQTGEED